MRARQKKVIIIPALSTQKVITEERKAIRVAAYCRVSTERENQEGSYKKQIFYYTEKISKRAEWEFVGIYADDGISGTNAGKRSDFLRMQEDCDKGLIDLILTKSISRFARNTVDLLLTIRKLKSKNIAVYFEKENINTLDATGEILITILSSQAQEESRNVSENVRWGIERKFEEGHAMINHNHCMGYTKDKKKQLKVVPKEAITVQMIFELYLYGYSSYAIATYLEEHRIRTVMGKLKWAPTVIDKMLINEKYIGDLLLQKIFTIDYLTKYRVKNSGIVPKYFVAENHPPIVERELVLRVQEERLRRSYLTREHGNMAKHRSSSRYPLTSKLICSNCGEPYQRITQRRKDEIKVVWRCYNRVSHGKRVCEKSSTIEELKLQKIIAMAFKCLIDTRIERYSDADIKLHIDKTHKEIKSRKKKIRKFILENIQGFWSQGRLVEYCEDIIDEIYQLEFAQAQLLQTSKEMIYCPKGATKYKRTEIERYEEFDNQMVALYIERIWIIDNEAIIILFQNGIMMKSQTRCLQEE